MMRHDLICFTLAVAVAASLSVAKAEARSGVVTSQAAPPPRPAWVPSTAELDRLRASLDVPGLALVALSGCEPTAPVSLGAASLEPEVAVTDRTVFEAASLSKPVFAYLVLQLVDEGVIDLDRPLAEDFVYPRVTDRARYGQLTPRMVLTHQTGLPNWAGDTDDPDRTDPIPFAASPGAGFSYSGEAYEMLRTYVEFRTGQTLDQLFRERLGDLMPLSSYAPPLPSGAEPARGYVSARAPGVGEAANNTGGAAGGLLTTATDYARFVGRVCAGRGLSAAIHAEMLTPVTPVTNGDYPGPAAFGLGWAVTRMGPETVVLHGGDNDEFRSLAVFLPEGGDGVVILTNGRFGGDLIDAIVERMQ